MADLVPDDVAVDVAGADAVTFVGYLSVGDSEGSWKLFDTCFQRWLVFSESQILHQISGQGQPGGRSTLWVKRDARITKCEVAPAIEFAGEFAKSEGQLGPAMFTRWPPY